MPNARPTQPGFYLAKVAHWAGDPVCWAPVELTPDGWLRCLGVAGLLDTKRVVEWGARIDVDAE